MSPAVRRLAIAATTVLLLAAAGCGESTGPAAERSSGSWAAQQLSAEAGADQAPVLAADGEDALVLTVSEDGTVRSHLSLGGGDFEAGEPLATGLAFLQLGGAVRLPDGDWFTLGSGGRHGSGNAEELAFEAVGLRSGDGLSWERVAVAGFAHPVDVSALRLVDDTLLVAGAYRTAENPGSGGFVAQVWSSQDAVSFAGTSPPGVRPAQGWRHESWAGHLAVSGERVLLAGQVDGEVALWASDTAALAWQRVEDPALADLGAVNGLEVVGDSVVLAGGEGRVSALRSTDDGATWAPVETLPGEQEAWTPLWSDRDRFWTLSGVDDMSWDRPEVCYADLAQCGQDPAPRVLTSTDGVDWAPVELAGASDGPDEVVGTTDGRVLVLTTGGDGPLVHTLAAGAAPPGAADPVEPRTVELVTPPPGGPAEVGVRYHAPMYVHCGMDWFSFADTAWRRTDDGPGVDTGSGGGDTEGWPMVGQMIFGYATLTDADHLEYAVDDEVIATYRRAARTPGCA